MASWGEAPPRPLGSRVAPAPSRPLQWLRTSRRRPANLAQPLHPCLRPAPQRLNIKTGERERVGVYELGQFLVFTIADFCDQLFSWQVWGQWWGGGGWQGLG
jgi:hypothetical protein